MVNKMIERRQVERQVKKISKVEQQAKRITDDAYENWCKEECASLELLERQGRMDYARIKEIIRKARNICKQIKNREG